MWEIKKKREKRGKGGGKTTMFRTALSVGKSFFPSIFPFLSPPVVLCVWFSRMAREENVVWMGSHEMEPGGSRKVVVDPTGLYRVK